jgi:ubiquinone/menaquinone biosynthesis C-methylase UbiE
MGMKTEYWIDEKTLYNLETAHIWNLPDKGAFTEDAERLIKHLAEDTRLLKQWEDTIKDIERNNFVIKGNGLDIGGGSGWVSAILSRRTDVRLIYLVDISKIRLERMLPISIKVFCGKPDTIKPVVGSFYNIKLPESSIDFVVMDQSLHHARYPLRLLCECNRVLKKDGILIITGEEPIMERYYYIKLIYRVMKSFFKKRTKRDLRFRALFPPAKMGDRHWRIQHYNEMFKLTGFSKMRSFFPGYQHKDMSFFSKILGQRFYRNFYGPKCFDYRLSDLSTMISNNKTRLQSKFLSEIFSDPEWI